MSGRMRQLMRGAARSPRWRWAGGLAGALLAGLAAGEAAGWPFLIEPLRARLAQALQRPVVIEGPARLQLLGQVRLELASLRIADTPWSGQPSLLVMEELQLVLRYRDLISAGLGQGLRVRSLRARELQAHLARRADGQANWWLGQAAEQGLPASAAPPVLLEELSVARFSGLYQDALITADARFSGTLTAAGPNGDAGGLQAQADGHYRQAEMHARLSASSPLPLLSQGGPSPPAAVDFQLSTGRVSLDFKGHVADLLGGRNLSGHYRLSGPSLAAVGQPVGITLPTTPAFTLQGELRQDGPRWLTHVASAQVGRSRLSGDFALDMGGGRKRLTGQLRAEVLWPADLAPALGAPTIPTNQSHPPSRRLLPQREFDLPSLKAMDAAVELRIARMPLSADGSTAIAPLQAELTLDKGRLQLLLREARLGDGRIDGRIGLAVFDLAGEAAAPPRPSASDPLGLMARPPAQVSEARWTTELRWSGIALEQLLPRPPTASGKPAQALKRGTKVPAGSQGPAAPYASGRLAGRLTLDGSGRSTAQILGSANGHAQVLWTRGTVSHLLVEAAGLDLAQSLGRLISGDEPLQVQCGAGALTFQEGRVRPLPLVIDTHDSTLWLDGSLSLQDESLDLRAVVSPKDGTPLSLRSPVRLQGTLLQPSVSIDKGPLLQKVLPSVLLALVNPLAGLIPLIDTGDQQAARQADQACRRLADRITHHITGRTR